jgi:integrase
MAYDMTSYTMIVDQIEQDAGSFSLRLLCLIRIMRFSGCRTQDLYNPDSFHLMTFPIVKLQPAKGNLIRTFESPALYTEIQYLLPWKNEAVIYWNYKKLYRFLYPYIPNFGDVWNKKDTVTYFFRFGYIQSLLNDGYSFDDIKAQMGHKSMNSTMEYINKLL